MRTERDVWFVILRLKETAKIMGEILSERYVVRSAAAFSYYLTLSIFPFLISVSIILGSFNFGATESFRILIEMLPVASVPDLSYFFIDINRSFTPLVAFLAISAMITTSSAAFRSYKGIMKEIHGETRFEGFIGVVFSFIMSLLLLGTIYISGIIILSGEWLIHQIQPHFNFDELFQFWLWVRFVLLFAMLVSIIYAVYIIVQPKSQKGLCRLPGALAASTVLVAVSMFFSWLITASIRYQVVYGSLATFVIIMVWLYICAVILIIGNVFNMAIHRTKP